jgi:hypothetical protein
LDCPFPNLHPRLRWQWEVSELPVLQVGCDGDPAQFTRYPGTTSIDIDWWPHANFQQMNAEKLTFPDKSYDTVLLCETLDHMQHPELAIAEAVRVARRLVAATMSYYGPEVVSEPENDWERKVAALRHTTVRLAPGDLKLRHGHHKRWSREDVRELFEPHVVSMWGPVGENPAEYRILIPCSV